MYKTGAINEGKRLKTKTFAIAKLEKRKLYEKFKHCYQKWNT